MGTSFVLVSLMPSTNRLTISSAVRPRKFLSCRIMISSNDLPDTAGDEKFHVRTLAVLYSKKNALLGGTVMVSAAYTAVILWSFFYATKNREFLLTTHGLLFTLFMLNYSFVKLGDNNSIKRFYLRFWVFFFAEYILFAAWMII